MLQWAVLRRRKRQEHFAPAMWIDSDNHANITESPKAIRPGGANRPYIHEDVDEDDGASCENTARLPRIENNNHTKLPNRPVLPIAVRPGQANRPYVHEDRQRRPRESTRITLNRLG